jgi:hypothetical protein
MKKLPEGETAYDDVGLFSCNLVPDIMPKFRVHGVALDRQRSVQSPQAAQPVATLVLSMSPTAALELAEAILRTATEANIELPKTISFQSAKA